MTDTTTPPAPRAKRRARPLSRPQRWAKAVGNASDAILHLRTAAEDVINSLGELRELQEEYNEWKENLPDNLQQSPVAEKLEEIEGLDIESVIDSLENVATEAEDLIGNAEGLDLPRGFGRD